MYLAVKCVRELNAMIDHDGIPLVRKAMIRCGLALNANGWEITQLFQHLQDIILTTSSITNGWNRASILEFHQ